MTNPGRRLLIVNRVHPPDPGATGRLAADLAASAAADGWQVAILACGTVEDARQLAPNVAILRVPAPAGRSMRAVLAQIAALRRGVDRLPAADVAVVMSDPPFAWSLGRAARRRGMTVVHWVQDLYPEVLPALGIRIPSLVANGLKWWRSREMAESVGIVAVGTCMATRLIEAGLPRKLVRSIANWPEDLGDPDPASSIRWRRRQGLEGRELVLLAGSLGRSMPVQVLGPIADRLADLRPKALVLVVGDGAKGRAVDRASVGRANLRRIPPVPSMDLAAMLGAGDVHLVLQAPETSGCLVPSRLLSALASGRPMVAAVPTGSQAAQQALRSPAARVLDSSDEIDVAAVTQAVAASLAERERGFGEPPVGCYDQGGSRGEWLALLDLAAGVTRRVAG